MNIIISDFVMNFSDMLDNQTIVPITEKTVFKELDEWSSLLALSVIAMVDDEYDVALKSDDIVESNTIADLFNIVKSKVA